MSAVIDFLFSNMETILSISLTIGAGFAIRKIEIKTRFTKK